MHPSTHGHVRLSAHRVVTAALPNPENQSMNLEFLPGAFPRGLIFIFLFGFHAKQPLCEHPLLGAGVAMTPAVSARQRDGGREPGVLREPGDSGARSDGQAAHCEQPGVCLCMPRA